MRRLFNGLVDLLFPPRCIACMNVLTDDDRPPFCRPCLAAIRFVRSPLCTRCGAPFEGTGEDHLCGDCLSAPPAFTIARSVARYESALLTSIHRFKYGGKTAVGKALGRFMARHPAPGLRIEAYTLVIPVPLDVGRLREREFNQALILAGELARPARRPVDAVSLTRRRGTDPQVRLGRDERRKNIRGAFAVTRPDRIAGRKILLVDDVYTTGSTVGECARVLMDHQAEAVAVLTLARA